MTLLDDAKAVRVRRMHTFPEKFTDEEIELAFAWAKGEIQLKQVMVAKRKRWTPQTLYWLAYALRAAVQRGAIQKT